MTTSEYLVLDSEHPLQTLQKAQEEIANGNTDLTLDFSAIRKVDPATLQALEELASRAEGSAVQVALRGVDVGVYKVLKLARLASHFSFVN
jgi:anti-anti-sigma regulatory factor